MKGKKHWVIEVGTKGGTIEIGEFFFFLLFFSLSIRCNDPLVSCFIPFSKILQHQFVNYPYYYHVTFLGHLLYSIQEIFCLFFCI